jgi:hypothetical protein
MDAVLNNMVGTGSPRSLLVEISAKIFDIRRDVKNLKKASKTAHRFIFCFDR